MFNIKQWLFRSKEAQAAADALVKLSPAESELLLKLAKNGKLAKLGRMRCVAKLNHVVSFSDNSAIQDIRDNEGLLSKLQIDQETSTDTFTEEYKRSQQQARERRYTGELSLPVPTATEAAVDIRVDVEDAKEDSGKKHTLTIHYIAKFAKISLPDPDSEKMQVLLDEKIRRALQACREKGIDQAVCRDVFSAFPGTLDAFTAQYVSAVALGGSAEIHYSFESEESAKRVSQTLKAEGKAVNFAAIHASMMASAEESAQANKMICNVHFSGGKASVVLQPKQLSQLESLLEDWSKTLSNAPETWVVLDKEMRPVWSLIDEPSKQLALREYYRENIRPPLLLIAKPVQSDIRDGHNQAYDAKKLSCYLRVGFVARKPGEYHAGQFIFASDEPINARTISPSSMVLKPANYASELYVLAPPEKFRCIWRSHRSLSQRLQREDEPYVKHSCWEPVAPNGYAPLGDVLLIGNVIHKKLKKVQVDIESSAEALVEVEAADFFEVYPEAKGLRCVRQEFLTQEKDERYRRLVEWPSQYRDSRYTFSVSDRYATFFGADSSYGLWAIKPEAEQRALRFDFDPVGDEEKAEVLESADQRAQNMPVDFDQLFSIWARYKGYWEVSPPRFYLAEPEVSVGLRPVSNELETVVLRVDALGDGQDEIDAFLVQQSDYAQVNLDVPFYTPLSQRVPILLSLVVPSLHLSLKRGEEVLCPWKPTNGLPKAMVCLAKLQVPITEFLFPQWVRDQKEESEVQFVARCAQRRVTVYRFCCPLILRGRIVYSTGSGSREVSLENIVNDLKQWQSGKASSKGGNFYGANGVGDMLNAMTFDLEGQCVTLNLTGEIIAHAYMSNTATTEPLLVDLPAAKAQLDLLKSSLIDEVTELTIKPMFYEPIPFSDVYSTLAISDEGADIKAEDRDYSLALNDTAGVIERLFSRRAVDAVQIGHHVLMYGEAGAGKTVGCAFIRRAVNDYYDWVFYIPLKHLTSYIYPEVQGPYRLVDVLFNASLLKGQRLNDTQIHGVKALLHNTLAVAAKVGKVLYILDGYDDASKSVQRYPHLRALLMSFWQQPGASVVLTTRSSHLSLFKKEFSTPEDGAQDFHLYRLHGFRWDVPLECIEKFLKNLRLDGGRKLQFTSGQIHSFEAFLSRDGNQKLLAMCRSPIHAELICSLWQAQGQEAVSDGLAAIYRGLMVALLKRHINKFETVHDADYETLLRHYEQELCFLDHFAYRSMNSVEAIASDDSINYVRDCFGDAYSYLGLTERTVQLGLAERSDVRLFTRFEKLRFIQPIWRDFFAARYLSACLKNKLGVSVSPMFSLQHQWRGDVALEEFIRQQLKLLQQQDSADVWVFVAGILTQDKQSVAYFYFVWLLLQAPQLDDQLFAQILDTGKVQISTLPESLQAALQRGDKQTRKKCLREYLQEILLPIEGVPASPTPHPPENKADDLPEDDFSKQLNERLERKAILEKTMTNPNVPTAGKLAMVQQHAELRTQITQLEKLISLKGKVERLQAEISQAERDPDPAVYAKLGSLREEIEHLEKTGIFLSADQSKHPPVNVVRGGLAGVSIFALKGEGGPASVGGQVLVAPAEGAGQLPEQQVRDGWKLFEV